MSSNGAHENQVVLVGRLFIFRALLLKKQHCQVHIRAEVDVHGHFESIDVHFVNASSETHCVVVDEHVHCTVFFDYLLPGLLSLLSIC